MRPVRVAVVERVLCALALRRQPIGLQSSDRAEVQLPGTPWWRRRSRGIRLGLLSLPAVGSAFRATVGGLVKVFDVLPDADDDHQRNLIKAPIRVAVQFAVRVRVADHYFLARRFAAEQVKT